MKNHLLKKLRKINEDLDKAPLNWRYNHEGTMVNTAKRASFVLDATKRLVELLPEIIQELED